MPSRRVKLFRNGRNQAVRIPREFELPGQEAVLTKDGDRLILEPPKRRGFLAALAEMTPLEEGDFPPIEDLPAEPFDLEMAGYLLDSNIVAALMHAPVGLSPAHRESR